MSSGVEPMYDGRRVFDTEGIRKPIRMCGALSVVSVARKTLPPGEHGTYVENAINRGAPNNQKALNLGNQNNQNSQVRLGAYHAQDGDWSYRPPLVPSYLLPAEFVEEYKRAYHGRVPEEEEVSIPENPIPKVERPIPKPRKSK